MFPTIPPNLMLILWKIAWKCEKSGTRWPFRPAEFRCPWDSDFKKFVYSLLTSHSHKSTDYVLMPATIGVATGEWTEIQEVPPSSDILLFLWHTASASQERDSMARKFCAPWFQHVLTSKICHRLAQIYVGQICPTQICAPSYATRARCPPSVLIGQEMLLLLAT